MFKKCDRSNHRPETSKACAAGTCQHTCEPSAIEKFPHAWTLRYSVNGKQVEKSFRDKVHETTGFTPHSLRHAYASAMLARGVQLTELAHFLGHKDINSTHAVYGHLLPPAGKRAVSALNAEFAEWSKADKTE